MSIVSVYLAPLLIKGTIWFTSQSIRKYHTYPAGWYAGQHSTLYHIHQKVQLAFVLLQLDKAILDECCANAHRPRGSNRYKNMYQTVWYVSSHKNWTGLSSFAALHTLFHSHSILSDNWSRLKLSHVLMDLHKLEVTEYRDSYAFMTQITWQFNCTCTLNNIQLQMN